MCHLLVSDLISPSALSFFRCTRDMLDSNLNRGIYILEPSRYVRAIWSHELSMVRETFGCADCGHRGVDDHRNGSGRKTHEETSHAFVQVRSWNSFGRGFSNEPPASEGPFGRSESVPDQLVPEHPLNNTSRIGLVLLVIHHIRPEVLP